MRGLIFPCPSCGTKNRVPGDKLHLNPKCGRCGHVWDSPANGKVIELDDASFDTVVQHSPLPVMVDFYSPTCGPCQMLAPVVDTLAQKFAGKVIVAKYDTSRFQMTAARFQIRGVPSLIFFKQGQVVDQAVGALPQADLEQRLQNLL
jgi:thioredoxin 2